MENILLDIAIEVAKYLTPRDISSCCAVSLHWREVFGTNEVWKGLCDSELEEHLRTTPCVVEPQFSLPEQHCSLAPISQWRAAYLREQHLWKNWRTGNSKTMEHKMDKAKASPELFVTNDLIMAFYKDSIELWDLKTNPPTQKDILLLGERCYYTPRALNNGIIILKGSRFFEGDFIKMFRVDLAQGTIDCKWQVKVNFDFSFKLVSSNKEVFNFNDSMKKSDIIITPGGKCIGHFWGCGKINSFYVWDFENGVELRKECCSSSLPEGALRIVGCKTGSKTCEDIIVALFNTMSPDLYGISAVTYRVYNVQQLCFLPFKQIVPVFSRFLIGFELLCPFDYCAITDNFLALSDSMTNMPNLDVVSDVRVYNYRSGHLLHKLPSKGTIQIINDSCFLFKMPKDDKTVLCSVFCPSAAILEDTTGCEVNNFRVVGKGLVEIISNSSTQVWRLNQFSSFKTGVLLPRCTDVNRAFTKVITTFDTILEEEDTFRVTYFW